MVNVDIFYIVKINCADVSAAHFLKENIVQTHTYKITVSVFDHGRAHQLINADVLSDLGAEKPV